MSENGDNVENNEPAEQEYPLAAPESEPEVKDAVWFPGRPDDPKEPEPPESFQFTLVEMLLLTAVVALSMGTVGLFPGGYEIKNFAGVVGIGVLLGMVVLTLIKEVRPIVRVAWWVMAGLYAPACVAAVVAR